MKKPAATEPESALPARLGLTPEAVAAWRRDHLTPGRDYHAAPGRPTLWTLAACGRLWLSQGLRYEPGRPQLAFQTRQVLVAWGQAGANPKVLHAHYRGHRPGSKAPHEMFRVLVPDARRWRKGQPVPAVWKNADLWEYDATVTENTRP